MKRLRFLVTSGPTQEPIDPVRFLSNDSTGVMGKNLVAAAKRRGHRVEHVECPKRARTARDLGRLLTRLAPHNDVLLMAAAVADARPARVAGSKIKKRDLRSIRLVKNPDVLANLARRKKKGQVFIGFGLESKDMAVNGKSKLRAKRCDLIVLQKVTKNDRPFGDRAIHAVLMDKSGKINRYRSVTKKRLAGILVRRAEKIHKNLARWPRG